MDKDKNLIKSSAAEYLTYIASMGDNEESIEMRYEDENIWLTQKLLAELYDVDVRTINEHIKNIFSDKELEEDRTIRKFQIVQKEGNRSVKREINHYNLQMIISVGFKVNNDRAVRFRKWAGQVVKNYTIQGWVMDKERLKKGHMFTDEYFERLLQSIREIRLSERKFYQKITDLYTTAFDYGSKANTTQLFFQTVQNKMHWAVHRHTAAELIVERADAELQAERQIPMTMQDWGKRLDSFLEFNGNELLIGSGKISSEKAKLHAETEFEKFRIIQDRLYQSDFDRFLLEGNEIEGQRS